MRNKVFYLLVVCFFCSVSVYAQNNLEEVEGDTPSFKDRLYFGGNFGLQFGTVTLIDVSPLVGYMITDKLSGGVGFTYKYYREKIPGYGTLSSSIYGGRVFGRYNITREFFAYSEYENLNWESIDYDFEKRRQWIPGLFIGGGYFQSFGRRGGISFTALYNVIYDNFKSPYNSPWVIRVGFTL